MNKKKLPFALTVLGILSTFTLAQSTQVISPALNSLSEYYTNIPYSTVLLLASIVSLTIIPCSAIAGKVVVKTGYRTMALLSMTLILTGGLLPFLVMRSFAATLFCRILVGAGVGISTPIAGALVMKLIPKEKQALWQGIGMGVMNVFGVLFQTLSGILCTVNLKMIWLVYALLLIPLLLALLFLREPEGTAPKQNGGKGHLPLWAYFTCLGFGLLYLFLGPMLLNISSILVQEGLGTAATAGTILSAYSIGGMLAGFSFGVYHKLLGKWTIPVSLILQVLGLALCAFGKSAPLIAIGTVSFGIAVHWVWPACLVDFGVLKANEGAFASGLFVAAMNAGNFLAAPMIGLIAYITGNHAPRVPVQVGFIGTAVTAAMWILANYKHQKS